MIQPSDNVAPLLELATDAQAGDPSARTSVLSLPDLLTTDPALTCELQFTVQAVHADGSLLYVVFEAYLTTVDNIERRIGVLIIDAADPGAPQAIGERSRQPRGLRVSGQPAVDPRAQLSRRRNVVAAARRGPERAQRATRTVLWRWRPSRTST